MICCIAIGCVIAFAIRFWRIITFQPIAKAQAFAPVARREVGGVTLSRLNVIAAPENRSNAKSYSTIFIIYLVCVGSYLAALNFADSFEFLVFNEVAFLDNRNFLIFFLVAYFSVLSLVYKGKRYFVNATQLVGVFATILGIVTLGLGIADLHLFERFQFAGGHSHHAHQHSFFDATSLVFHGVSIVFITAGLMIYRIAK